jgi:gluconolactonase
MSWRFERLAGPYTLTEGPAWDGSGLLFSDIMNDRIMRFDPGTNRVDVFRTGTEGGNGLMFDREGRLYGCQQWARRIVRYEPTGSTTTIVDRLDGKRLNSPNDLALDSQGRVWFTDPRYRAEMPAMELDHHSVLRATPAADGTWTLERITFDTARPNGLLISIDEKTLYVAESPPAPNGVRELRAYPIRDDGTVGQHEVLHNFGPHRGIDGMCLDAEGNIVATCGWEVSGPGGRIAVFAPDGRVLEEHPMPAPVKRPTNCTFGGPEKRTLYVTDIDGHLHRAETDHVGHNLWPT